MRNAIILNNFRIEQGDNRVCLTDTDVLLLIAIQEYRRLGRFDKNFPMTCTFTFSMVYDSLGIANRGLKRKLESSLFKLRDIGYLEFLKPLKTINKNSIIDIRLVGIENHILKGNSYTNIDMEDFYTIIESEYDTRAKQSMLFLYITISSYIGNRGFAYPTYEKLMQTMGVKSNGNIIDNLKNLKELNLIDYHSINRKNGSKTKSVNVYVKCKGDYKKRLFEGMQFIE